MNAWIKKGVDGLAKNHGLLMALCIGPWIVLGAAYALGFRHPLLWPAALVLCIGSHVLMMAAHSDKEGKTCH
ncbi:hypothetical protein HY572_06200 [Candidatus Micrarchaeota archaeon]|nr:hypothetical protein [Candidatus Micrarchaeota archaeon]